MVTLKEKQKGKRKSLFNTENMIVNPYVLEGRKGFILSPEVIRQRIALGQIFLEAKSEQEKQRNITASGLPETEIINCTNVAFFLQQADVSLDLAVRVPWKVLIDVSNPNRKCPLETSQHVIDLVLHWIHHFDDNEQVTCPHTIPPRVVSVRVAVNGLNNNLVKCLHEKMMQETEGVDVIHDENSLNIPGEELAWVDDPYGEEEYRQDIANGIIVIGPYVEQKQRQEKEQEALPVVSSQFHEIKASGLVSQSWQDIARQTFQNIENVVQATVDAHMQRAHDSMLAPLRETIREAVQETYAADHETIDSLKSLLSEETARVEELEIQLKNNGLYIERLQQQIDNMRTAASLLLSSSEQDN